MSGSFLKNKTFKKWHFSLFREHHLQDWGIFRLNYLKSWNQSSSSCDAVYFGVHFKTTYPFDWSMVPSTLSGWTLARCSRTFCDLTFAPHRSHMVSGFSSRAHRWFMNSSTAKSFACAYSLILLTLSSRTVKMVQPFSGIKCYAPIRH
jgi:hypothetical protein